MNDLDKFFNDKSFNDNTNTGMRAAYWLWAKNQAYEKTQNFRQQGKPCTPIIGALQPDSDNPVSYSLAATPKLEWTALANALPEKGVAPLETRVLKINLTDRDNLTSFKQLSLKVTNTDDKPLDKQKIRYKWYSDPNPKDKPTCGVGEDTEADKDNRIKYAPIKNTRNLYILISNVSIDKATSADRINLEDVKVTIEPVDATMLATSSTGGSSINLSGKVNEYTNTEQLKITNTGDIDSTLEYKQYFASTNIIDFNNPNPAPAPAKISSSVQTRSVVVPPAVDYSLYAAYGFNPNSSSEGSLTVEKDLPPPSNTVDVNYYCSRAGTFNANINIVYSTGAVDENGKEILENAVVPVSATCTRSTAPKISALSGPNTAVRLLFNTSGSVAVTFSNQGNAPLEYSSSVATGTLDPDASVTVQVPVYCGWIPGDQDVPFYVNSNDPDDSQKSLIITVHCYGEIIANNIPIIEGYYNIVGFIEGIGHIASIGGTMSLRFPTISNSSGLISTSYDIKNFPFGDYFIPELSGNTYVNANSLLKTSIFYSNAGIEPHYDIMLSEYDFEHGILPYGLYYSELAKFPSKIDDAITLFQSLLINDANQSTTITNIQKFTTTRTDFFGTDTTTTVTADVKFSFN